MLTANNMAQIVSHMHLPVLPSLYSIIALIVKRIQESALNTTIKSVFIAFSSLQLFGGLCLQKFDFQRQQKLLQFNSTIFFMIKQLLEFFIFFNKKPCTLFYFVLRYVGIKYLGV